MLKLVLASKFAAFTCLSWAAAQGLPSSLLACRDIADDSERLECFDQAVAGIDESALASIGALKEDEIAAAEPALSPEERFGREDLQEAKEERRKDEKKELKSLAAKVVEIAQNRRGKYVVVLDNGQVWRQLKADTNSLLIPSSDDEEISVEIKRRFLGAHVLSLVGDNRSIRVERIK